MKIKGTIPIPPDEAASLMDPETTEETVEVKAEALYRLIGSYLASFGVIHELTEAVVGGVLGRVAEPATVSAHEGGTPYLYL